VHIRRLVSRSQFAEEHGKALVHRLFRATLAMAILRDSVNSARFPQRCFSKNTTSQAGEKYAQPRPSLQAETMGRQSDAAAHFPPKEHNGPRVHYGLSLLIRSIGPFVPDFLRNYRCTGRLRST
jgi:hypothetical protein